MRALPAILLLLAGCAGGQGCPAVLANDSPLPVEQFYLARMGEAWGPDLMTGGDLAPGGSLPIRFAAAGNYGVRAVWTNGHAAEMQGIEACRIRRITVRDGGLQAE